MEDGFAIHRLLNGALEAVGILTSRLSKNDRRNGAQEYMSVA